VARSAALSRPSASAAATRSGRRTAVSARAWSRRQQRLALTAKHRPDLIAQARQAGRLTRADEDFLARL